MQVERCVLDVSQNQKYYLNMGKKGAKAKAREIEMLKLAEEKARRDERLGKIKDALEIRIRKYAETQDYQLYPLSQFVAMEMLKDEIRKEFSVNELIEMGAYYKNMEDMFPELVEFSKTLVDKLTSETQN